MAIEDLQPLPRKSYRKRVVPFTAGDGFLCDLIHVRGPGTPATGPIILANRPRLVTLRDRTAAVELGNAL